MSTRGQTSTISILAFKKTTDDFYTARLMVTRYSRSLRDAGRPRRRWAVFSLAALAVGGGVVWIAPTVLVLTHLRDRPLEAAFQGIDGRVSSRAATWTWLGGIEYRDLVLCDRSGRVVVTVQRMLIDRGLLALAMDPTHLGTVRLVGGEAMVEVRRGGSGIEDILAPWLAQSARVASSPMSFELEVVDTTVDLVDLDRRDAWRMSELIVAGTVRSDATLAGWTVSGRVLHAPAAARTLAAVPSGLPLAATVAASSTRLDRTTIAAGAMATVSRDGGCSVSSPAGIDHDSARTLSITTNRLPLGVSSVLATRFDTPHLLDGLADVRLDITLPAAPGGQAVAAGTRTMQPGTQVMGMIAGSQLALCRSDTLAELVTLDRCEMPLDVTIDGRMLTIRNMKVSSPLLKAEASGRIGIPQGSVWEWAEAIIGDNFALAADIDLAAASLAIPGGLKVRPDVRVLAGQLQVSAASHPDGGERVLEVRTTSRDLAAVQGERQLRWNEPFTAWLRGRRGPAQGDRLRIEEARIASSAVEVEASGTAETSHMQWTVDLGKLVQEASEVLDIKALTLAGTARGQVDIQRLTDGGAATAKISASLSAFELVAAGQPEWRDDEITLEAEGTGSMAGGAMLIDTLHGVVSSSDDKLEMTLTGGTLVDYAAGWASGQSDVPWMRPAPQSQGVSADWSLVGDLGRWHARFAGMTAAMTRATTGSFKGSGQGIDTLTLTGKVKASAALAARDSAWQIERAGCEIEKLAASFGGRHISEPRVVASAAGVLNPGTGRVEISSAEILTATVSLRTGGFVILPPPLNAMGNETIWDGLARLRGKTQWQADIGRIEKWLVSMPTASRWPAGGRGWGTVEILDTPTGLNVLVEATGSQLTLSSAATNKTPGNSGDVPSRQVWAEPNAKVVLEVTRGITHSPDARAGSTFADRMIINKLSLESSTIAVAATGSVGELSAKRLVELGGTVTYDWQLMSQLLTPWTGGRLQVAGGGPRPFAMRGPLGSVPHVAMGGQPVPSSAEPQPPENHSLAMPTDWLSSVRDRSEGINAGTHTRIALPVLSPKRPQEADLAEWLRGISIDTSTAWTAADMDGFRIDSGEMAVRLFEGQLALGPFEIAASGGRLRGAPWVRLLPPPGELIVPPGRIIDRVALSSRLCDQWIAWSTPLLGHAAHTQGVVSVDVAGARVPLGDPFGGEMSGQLIFENLEVTPGLQTQPLVNLIVKLQSIIDPRFAFGDKVVLLRVRPDPVRVKMVERRLWHEGLVMEMGQLVVRSGGSVGEDGSLSMVVEVALRGDIAGTLPVVAQLLRTPLAIPLRGTVERPQFDARAIDTIIGRIVENTAEAVITDGLSRGLEGLFGSPPPVPPK